MKLKDRIKTYNFWVSLSSAVFLFLKVLGNQFGFKVNENMFSDLITSLCGILVILGIIVPPTYKNSEQTLAENTDSIIDKSNNINQPVDEDLENHSNLTLENVTFDQQNESKLDISEEISTQPTENEDATQKQNSFDINITENDVNIEELKLQVAKTLLNQEKLLEGHSSLYIELLQTQINNMLNK